MREKFYSIRDEERTLHERVETLEERLVAQTLEEKLHTFQFPVLHGKKAVNALHDFISKLQEQRTEELTEKQTRALIKLANGLIQSIKANMSMMNTHIEWYASPEKVHSLYLS